VYDFWTAVYCEDTFRRGLCGLGTMTAMELQTQGR
jgi:hypothetical protein